MAASTTTVRVFRLLLALVAVLVQSEAFQIIGPGALNRQRVTASFSVADPRNDDPSSPSNADDDSNIQEEEEEPVIATSTVRIDDGGSDLTDRFKYKVNALMGVFDPVDAQSDTDRDSTGNILNAMLKFPLDYSFNVVGRTAGDDDVQEEFIQQVKAIVANGSGREEERIVCQITPRGKKFTKVTVQATVESAEIITLIYKELEELELSVMQF